MVDKHPKKKDRSGVDEYGRCPLHYAALEGDVPAMETALRAGEPVDAQDDNGMVALHFAAQGNHGPVAAALLSHGADPNLVDHHGNGPLWTATMNARGNNEIVEMLLRSGAVPDHKNIHGRSPLDVARTIKHGLEEPFAPYISGA